MKIKIIHYGEIYRLISFHYFIKKLDLDIETLRILDIGFNKGLFRWYFLEVLGCFSYTGVEIDEEYLNKYPNTFYHDFENHKLKKKYNLIFCSHVLEHVKDDYHFLLNMINSLDDNNGKTLIRVPKPTDEKIYLRVLNLKEAEDQEHERDGYTINELKILLSRVGLKIENHYYSMGSLGLAVHTFFEILRDYQIRFQRILQIPYIFISILDIYFFSSKSSSDLLVLATKK